MIIKDLYMIFDFMETVIFLIIIKGFTCSNQSQHFRRNTQAIYNLLDIKIH